MKHTAILIATVFAYALAPTLSHAQGMSDKDIHAIMQAAQEAQTCFEKIDQSSFKHLETRGEAIEAELKGLCDAGKRAEAMRIAKKYAKEFNALPEMKEMQKCSAMMEGMMKDLPIPNLEEAVGDTENGHVCDSI